MTGNKAWLAVVTLVVLHEATAPEGELLSEAVDRYLEKCPALTWLAITVTAAHLLNVLPPKFDPYARVAEMQRKYS